jgi:DNA-binding response OmpR family regulator
VRKKLLHVEDDPTLQLLVQEALPDFDVSSAATLADARQYLPNLGIYSCLLLDLDLPDGSGIDLLSEVNFDPGTAKLPILIVSSSSVVQKKVMAFQLGAEDYIVKPFDALELRARVTAKVERFRKEAQASAKIAVADIVIDTDRLKVFRNNNGSTLELDLTPIELKLLRCLSSHMERVYTREELIEVAWGSTHISDRTVDSHLAHLRKKLQDSQLRIEAVKGIGYRAHIHSLSS